MSSMSRPWAILLAGVAAAAGLFAGSSLEGEPPFTPKPVGSYLVEVEGPGGGTGHLLATFTDSGQVLTSHSGDFGDNPFLCEGEPPGPTSAGHGSWRREGMTIHFLVVANRFDDDGKPIGFQKAVGQAQPTRGGKPAGRVRLAYFAGFAGDPVCSTDLAFVATPLRPPARRQDKERG